MDVDNEMCELILRDPAIQSLLPVIHASYSNFFSLHETQLARNILGSENPWKMLESFPLYQIYENMITVHVQNSPKIKVLALIGCGPLPITLLLFSKLYGIRCIGIDKDAEAVALAKSCVKHFGIEKEISIIEGDETVLSKFELDSVLIAGLAEPKKRIFRNLRNIIKKRKKELKNQIFVCYRNYTGIRQVLYRSVRPEHTRGFRKIKEIYPSGGVNNTLVFLECE
jgi:precorrin-6B methylase 2